MENEWWFQRAFLAIAARPEHKIAVARLATQFDEAELAAWHASKAEENGGDAVHIGWDKDKGVWWAALDTVPSLGTSPSSLAEAVDDLTDNVSDFVRDHYELYRDRHEVGRLVQTVRTLHPLDRKALRAWLVVRMTPQTAEDWGVAELHTVDEAVDVIPVHFPNGEAPDHLDLPTPAGTRRFEMREAGSMAARYVEE